MAGAHPKQSEGSRPSLPTTKPRPSLTPKAANSTATREHPVPKQIKRRLLANRVAPVVLLIPLIALILLLLFGFFYGFAQSFGLLMPGKFAQSFTLDYYRSVLTKSGLVTSILLSTYHSLVSTSIATVIALEFS